MEGHKINPDMFRHVTYGYQPKAVDESKLASSSVPKSKYQREKEAAEEKAKREEEAAAKAYSEFVQSFEGSPSKGFVKAGTSSVPASGPRAGPSANRSRLEDDEPIPQPVNKKKRNMDAFLEELKRDQADRENRYKAKAGSSNVSITALAARESRHPSDIIDDDRSTNVHVHPLPAGISEDDLGLYFAQFGNVGSVKIMWPRDEGGPSSVSAIHGGVRRSKSAGLGGFICMMDRKAAERAILQLEGKEWMGCVLRVGWGKPVSIPPVPAFEATRDRSRDRERSPTRTRHGSSRHGSEDDHSYRSSFRRGPLRSRSRSPPRSRSRSPSPRVWPKLASREDEDFIESVADKIKSRGRRYEDMLRDEERHNPRYAFLFDTKLPDHHFFKMLMDRRYRYVEPITFEDDGEASVYSTDSAEESEKERYKRRDTLGKIARRKLEAMLRSVSTARDKIARVMAFIIEHGEAAEEISELVVQSTLLPTTPLSRKMARLYLISDILANSSAPLPSAWRFRSAFEPKLPTVFDHLNQIYASFPGRMKAETFKQQVMQVINLWETMLIFTPAVIELYTARLSGEKMIQEAPVQPQPQQQLIRPTESTPATKPASEPQSQPAIKPVAFKKGFRSIKLQPRDVDVNASASAMDTGDLDGAVIDDVDGVEI